MSIERKESLEGVIKALEASAKAMARNMAVNEMKPMNKVELRVLFEYFGPCFDTSTGVWCCCLFENYVACVVGLGASL
jgi:hypothetical protein